MTAPDPRDLLTAALVATERWARLSEKRLHGDLFVTDEMVDAARDEEATARVAAYVAVERAMSELGAVA